MRHKRTLNQLIAFCPPLAYTYCRGDDYFSQEETTMAYYPGPNQPPSGNPYGAPPPVGAQPGNTPPPSTPYGYPQSSASPAFQQAWQPGQQTARNYRPFLLALLAFPFVALKMFLLPAPATFAKEKDRVGWGTVLFLLLVGGGRGDRCTRVFLGACCTADPGDREFECRSCRSAASLDRARCRPGRGRARAFSAAGDRFILERKKTWRPAEQCARPGLHRPADRGSALRRCRGPRVRAYEPARACQFVPPDFCCGGRSVPALQPPAARLRRHGRASRGCGPGDPCCGSDRRHPGCGGR